MIIKTQYGELEILPPEDQWDSQLIYINSHNKGSEIGFAIDKPTTELLIQALQEAIKCLE